MFVGACYLVGRHYVTSLVKIMPFSHLCDFVQCVGEKTSQFRCFSVHNFYVRPPLESTLQFNFNNINEPYNSEKAELLYFQKKYVLMSITLA